jgi:excisionase family DNA binding protein
MVSPEQAAQIADLSLRTVYRWVEAGTVHFIEDRTQFLICVPGLFAASAKNTKRN